MPPLHYTELVSPDQAFLLTGRRSTDTALDVTHPSTVFVCTAGMAQARAGVPWALLNKGEHSTKRGSFVLDGGAGITVPASAEYTGSCSLPRKGNQLFSRFRLWCRNNCFKVDPESILYLKQPLYLIWIKFQFLMRAGQEGFQACEYELCDATCQTSQNTYRGDISSHCQH